MKKIVEFFKNLGRKVGTDSRTKFERDAMECLERLRRGRPFCFYEGYDPVDFLLDVKESVAEKKTSWERLGTDEDELDRLIMRAREVEAAHKLEQIMRETYLGLVFPKKAAAEIKTLIEEGGASWERLGTDEKEFDEKVRQAEEKRLLFSLTELQTGRRVTGQPHSSWTALADEIKAAVQEGVTTWEYLRTTPEGLERLLKKRS